ncbi:hypothetical protein [Tomitella gaofuii]|nr:hypothetical protein [Tomitella gaofuii]
MRGSTWPGTYGSYLGLRLGAYLAAERWGCGVLPGETVDCIRTPGSAVTW